MAEEGNHRRRYSLHASGEILEAIGRIQRRAKREGRGDRVLSALAQIQDRLERDPQHLGEPLYRLSALRLDVRTCIIRPLVVDFAVHEENALVFIKSVRLITELS
jgi:hypothetical protein